MTTTQTTTTTIAYKQQPVVRLRAPLFSSIFLHERTHVLMCGAEQRELLSMSLSSPSATSSSSSSSSASLTSSSSIHQSLLSQSCAAAASFEVQKNPSSPAAAAAPIVAVLSQQQQQQKPSGVSHLSDTDRSPPAMNSSDSNAKDNDDESQDNVSSTGFGGLFMATLMPLYKCVKGFISNIVFPPATTTTEDTDDEYSDVDDDDDDYEYVDDDDFSSAFAGGLDLAATASNFLFGDATPKPGNNLRRTANGLYQTLDQPQSFLQTSLLELIAMEAPQCIAAPAQMAHGIGAAVELYLSGLQKVPQREPTLVAQPPTPPLLSKMATAPTTTSTTSTNAKLTLKKQRKRKHYLRYAAGSNQQTTNTHGNIVWPRSGSDASTVAARATTPVKHQAGTTTTMKTLSTTLNVRPLHKNTNKNRREKERHALNRHIYDDLLDEDQRQQQCSGDEAHGRGEDTVDFCIVRSASVTSSSLCASIRNRFASMPVAADVGQRKSSFTCFTHEDFPEMVCKTTTVRSTTNDAKRCGLASGSTATVIVTVSAATPASTHKPSIRWEISADELRTPSHPPERLRARMNAIASEAVATSAAAAAPVVATCSTTAQSPPHRQQCQMQLLLAVRPHRERQISECSDDFICFEKDGSDSSICYDVAYDSSEFDETDEESSDSENDDDDDVDDDDDDDAADTLVANDDDDDSDSDSDSASETNSATHQLDSGFEEKKVNQVRFADVHRVHYIHAWPFAYRQARKSHWEQIGRDRVRFADRVRRLQDTLNPVLDARHRERVWRQRFEQQPNELRV